MCGSLAFRYLGRGAITHPAGSAFSNKDIATRRNPDQARIVETAGEKFDDKTGRRLGPGIVGTRQYSRSVVGAGRRIWLRHVRWKYLTPHSRRIAPPIAVCSTAGQNGCGWPKTAVTPMPTNAVNEKPIGFANLHIDISSEGGLLPSEPFLDG